MTNWYMPSRILTADSAFSAKSTFAQNSGASATDSKTSTLSVEATDFCPAPFYDGKLETDEGDIKGSDGSVWTASDGG